jgi:hypothetical protein
VPDNSVQPVPSARFPVSSVQPTRCAQSYSRSPRARLGVLVARGLVGLFGASPDWTCADLHAVRSADDVEVVGLVLPGRKFMRRHRRRLSVRSCMRIARPRRSVGRAVVCFEWPHHRDQPACIAAQRRAPSPSTTSRLRGPRRSTSWNARQSRSMRGTACREPAIDYGERTAAGDRLGLCMAAESARSRAVDSHRSLRTGPLPVLREDPQLLVPR